VERLREIGLWMKRNGESIYGTAASPFASLPWGRCTQKPVEGGTRLYLHVFDYPAGGELVVPGILSTPRNAYLLAGLTKNLLPVTRRDDALVIALPGRALDTINTVVVLDIEGKPDVTTAPAIASAAQIFVDTMEVALTSARENVEIRYTLDGSLPAHSSPLYQRPIRLTASTTVTTRCFRGGAAVSPASSARFEKVPPRAAVSPGKISPGLRYAYYEGDWNALPDFRTLKPVLQGVAPSVTLDAKRQRENYGFTFEGYIRIPRDGVYRLATESDDGSRLVIGDVPVVESDGLHGMVEKSGVIALAAGYHPIRITYFQGAGGDGLTVTIAGPGMEKQPIAPAMLFHVP
jgi:alpha-L-fucosidase